MMFVPLTPWHVKKGKSFNLWIFIIGLVIPLAEKALVLLNVILLRQQRSLFFRERIELSDEENLSQLFLASPVGRSS
jgi:hypothetical protein